MNVTLHKFGTSIALVTVAMLITACGPAHPTASPTGSGTPSRQPAGTASAPGASTGAGSASASGSASGSASPTPLPLPPGAVTASMFRGTVPALPTTVSVREVGPVTQNARVADRDAGQSTLYGTKSVWFFADTTLKNPWGFLSNSAAATTDLNAADGIDLRSGNGFTVDNAAAPTETIPRTAPELAFQRAHAAPTGGCAGSPDQYCGATFSFWPGAVFADPARHRVLFMYSKQCRGGPDGTPCAGGIGKGLGNGFGAVDMTTGTVTRLVATGGATADSLEGKDPTLFFPAGDKASIGGNAAIVVDDTVYLYGQCTYFDCAVGRVALPDFTDRAAWRYYNGSTFGADPTAAARVQVQSGGSGNTVFYDPALKAFVDVYMPWGYNTIWYRVGGSPFGPWSAGQKLITTAGNTAEPNYSTYGHPEFAEKNGLVQYISYYNASTGAQGLVRWELR